MVIVQVVLLVVALVLLAWSFVNMRTALGHLRRARETLAEANRQFEAAAGRLR